MNTDAVNTNAVTKASPVFHLDHYQWHYRALLIFSPTDEYPAFQQQMRQIQGQEAGFQERDLKLVYLLENNENYAEHEPISHAIAAQIRLQFAVEPNEFAVILVGKDGTQKHRYPEPIAVEELFAAIDSMPMRQHEMQQGKHVASLT